MKHSKNLTLILVLFFITLNASNCGLVENMDHRKSKVPSFFGEESIKLQEDIKKTTESIRVIEDALKLKKFEIYPRGGGRGSTSNGMEGILNERTLKALSDVEKTEIIKNIEMVLIMDDDKLNEKEKKFWREYLDVVHESLEKSQ
ncbi:hypothetical protein [Aquimarina sp. MMG016]|uniref:hypothetical protein n=1 Tax=Aquimarina sp. MMG016 TaxID=2822690 RepID=UPI001B3A15AB|nr:hypothetical protein [Aquimarina sp. MMG016]MBQ4818597.1 hypothetical protein [Aquimarina sp. MMG016]